MSIPHIESAVVSDVALGLDAFPVLTPTDLLKTALEQMTAKRLGIVCIVDDNGVLRGVFTDGDIRRHLLSVQRPFSAFFADDVIDHAEHSPTTIQGDASLDDALELMRHSRIWDLPVIDSGNRLIGLLHLHPLVDAMRKSANSA